MLRVDSQGVKAVSTSRELALSSALTAHDGIHWYPTVVIAKYSPDQTAFAERALASPRVDVERFQRGQPYIHGDTLRALCGEPEDGYAYDAGNQLVNVGLSKLALWITGQSAGNYITGSSGTNFGYCAVGDSATAWAPTQTDLQSSSNKYYNQIDSGYPTANASATPGLITVQSTFTGSNANFAWNEWGWGTSTSAVANGGASSQPATGGNDSLFNRKVPASSLGTKGSGASWVFLPPYHPIQLGLLFISSASTCPVLMGGHRPGITGAGGFNSCTGLH